LRFVVAASLLVLACGLELGPIRGIGQAPIVGGEAVPIQEAPHQMALLYDSTGLGFYSLRCGGSAISQDFILTAAHCLQDTSTKRWRIRAGSSTHASGGQVIAAANVIIHESYSDWTLDFDIGMIKLEEELDINGVTIALAVLPPQGLEVEAGELAEVTGWGTTTSGGSIPANLRKVTVPVVDRQTCSDNYQNLNHVTTNMICAGISGKDACQGDSGGPLIVKNLLTGITSWGYGCAQDNFPGVYTNVAAFIDWIGNQL